MDASGNFVWAKRFGNTNDDFGMAIATDALGNVYTTGRFQGTADFNPGAATNTLTSAGGIDIFIQKLDASGNFLWAKRCGGPGADYGQFICTDVSGNVICTDVSGNVYITGAFAGNVDFDPGSGITSLLGAGGEEIYVLKLNASGNFMWARAFAGSANDFANSICVDGSGNVYTTGYFHGNHRVLSWNGRF